MHVFFNVFVRFGCARDFSERALATKRPGIPFGLSLNYLFENVCTHPMRRLEPEKINVRSRNTKCLSGKLTLH